MTPLCAVLMPSGRMTDASGTEIDFDQVYSALLAPAVRDAGLEPFRVQNPTGKLSAGLVERLLLGDLLLVDLSLADAGLYCAVGQHQGARPGRTVAVYRAGSSLPLNAGLLQTLAYTPGSPGDRGAVADRLRRAQSGSTRPVHELLDRFAGLQRLKTDVFRSCVDYDHPLKDRLAAARAAGSTETLRAIQAELAAAPGGLAEVESGVVVDLLLSYRALKAWPDMIALPPLLSPLLAATSMVQEQLGLALNRAGRPDEAERVLQAVISKHGPSSETCSLLGRVYKDRWEAALSADDAPTAKSWLARAIAAYLQGFETDWRDAFPGINAVTLMELQAPPDPRRHGLLPVVRYAVARRVAAGQPDYWDHATRIELAVLGGDEAEARQALSDALAAVREPWEPESTARNLRLIRQARAQRGETLPWCRAIEDALAARATRP